MTEQEVSDFISNTTWIFAKTYANTSPHEYCLFNKCRDKDGFNRFVANIKKNGVKERFYSTFFTYFHHGDYKYWTMEKEGEQAILINRALKKYTYDTKQG
jgi:lipocalin